MSPGNLVLTDKQRMALEEFKDDYNMGFAILD